MSDIFVSYVEENSSVAEQIAQGLEGRGYTTWYYERDSLFGTPWLTQVGDQIKACKAMLLLISPQSLESPQITTEIDWARHRQKHLMPVLLNVTHEGIEERQEHMAIALGTIVTIPIPPEGVTDWFIGRLVDGLKNLKIEPEGTGPKDEVEAGLAEVRPLLNDPVRRAAAESALRKLEERFPEAARVHRHLGEFYNRSFRPADAIAAFARAVELEPSNGLLRWDLGLANQRAGRIREAAANLQVAVELGLDPTRERHARTLLRSLEARLTQAVE